MEKQQQDEVQSSEEQRKFRKAKQNAQTNIKEIYNPPQKVVNKEAQLPERKRRNCGNNSSNKNKDQQFTLEDHGTFLFIVPKKQKTNGLNKASTVANTNLISRQEVQASENTEQANLDSDVQNQNLRNKSGSAGVPEIGNQQQLDVNQITRLKRGDCLLLQSGQVVIVLEPPQQQEQRIEVQIFLKGEDVKMIQLGDIPELYLTDETKWISAAEICRKVVLHFNKLKKSTEFICRQLYYLDSSDNQYVFKHVDVTAVT
eukprot:TRINITY_DN9448_c0_g2_i1.p2 TRINITY_DN9448_c0_g2~~TRINITY_DN9448_c0_g2_i1.p2  ORF type:complete len:258 (-),score=23.30 TRINITY_DN9448_c0_g2_i1:348-1121(-)